MKRVVLGNRYPVFLFLLLLAFRIVDITPSITPQEDIEITQKIGFDCKLSLLESALQ